MSGWLHHIKSLVSGVVSNVTYEILKYIFLGFLPVIVAFCKLHFFPSFLPHLQPIYTLIISFIILLIVWGNLGAYKKNKERFMLLNSSGLFYFRQNIQRRDREENGKLLKEKIQSAKSVEILGATGYKTFAKPSSGIEEPAILREGLEKNVIGEIKVLLLHPDAKQTRMRASRLGVPLEEYRSEIFKSIDFLKELKSKGKSVALKLYNQRPIWKMIILDDFLWLQYYRPECHVEKMPVYGIYKKQDSANLFDPLYAVFGKKWDFDYNPIYDFEKDELEYRDEKGNIRKEPLKR